jgi:hypothetical protein
MDELLRLRRCGDRWNHCREALDCWTVHRPPLATLARMSSFKTPAQEKVGIGLATVPRQPGNGYHLNSCLASLGRVGTHDNLDTWTSLYHLFHE